LKLARLGPHLTMTFLWQSGLTSCGSMIRFLLA
jgi:hypothetical protein